MFQIQLESKASHAMFDTTIALALTMYYHVSMLHLMSCIGCLYGLILLIMQSYRREIELWLFVVVCNIEFLDSNTLRV